MAQGWVQIVRLPGRPHRPGAARSAPTSPGSSRANGSSSPRSFGPIERFTYRVLRVRPDAEPGLEGLRALDDRLQPALLAGALPDPPHPEHPAVQPRGLPLRALEPQLQHRLLVRHQHQLAVLRRRNDAHLLRPDGRAGGPELRLGRGRDRGAGGGDPRLRRPQRASRSATSGPTWSGSRFYILLPISFVAALVLVSQGVIQTLDGSQADPHDRRRHPDAGAGAGRLAGGDQGARHQRRRLLQRQQRLPVREPERLDQLPRAAADPGDPGRASPTPSGAWSATGARAGPSTSR